MPDNKEKLNYTCPYCEVLFEDRDSLGKHVILTHWGKGDKIDNQNTDVEMYDLQSGREVYRFSSFFLQKIKISGFWVGLHGVL